MQMHQYQSERFRFMNLSRVLNLLLDRHDGKCDHQLRHICSFFSFFVFWVFRQRDVKAGLSSESWRLRAATAGSSCQIHVETLKSLHSKTLWSSRSTVDVLRSPEVKRFLDSRSGNVVLAQRAVFWSQRSQNVWTALAQWLMELFLWLWPVT